MFVATGSKVSFSVSTAILRLRLKHPPTPRDGWVVQGTLKEDQPFWVSPNYGEKPPNVYP